MMEYIDRKCFFKNINRQVGNAYLILFGQQFFFFALPHFFSVRFSVCPCSIGLVFEKFFEFNTFSYVALLKGSENQLFSFLRVTIGYFLSQQFILVLAKLKLQVDWVWDLYHKKYYSENVFKTTVRNSSEIFLAYIFKIHLNCMQ